MEIEYNKLKEYLNKSIRNLNYTKELLEKISKFNNFKEINICRSNILQNIDDIKKEIIDFHLDLNEYVFKIKLKLSHN